MPSHGVQRFMRALQEAERTRDPEPLVRLFTDDARLTSIPKVGEDVGQQGARAFWDTYLSTFSQIASRFTNVVEQGNTAALEWTAEGTLRSGTPVFYEGISIIEL